jgi:broad specificity phosphatase PhoE
LSSNHFLSKKILLVRHGQTDWNDIQKFQGTTDIPLNEAGLAQAEAVARRVAGWPVDVVYVSPLTRARQTADLIAAAHGQSPVVMEELKEVNFGSWEGLHYKTLTEQKDKALLKWIADPFFCIPEGGEDWTSIKRRAERVVQRVLDSQHRHTVIVSHGGIMKALLVAFLDFDPHTVWKINALNCSLTGIEVREYETALIFANDCLHLKETRSNDPLPLW